MERKVEMFLKHPVDWPVRIVAKEPRKLACMRELGATLSHSIYRITLTPTITRSTYLDREHVRIACLRRRNRDEPRGSCGLRLIFAGENGIHNLSFTSSAHVPCIFRLNFQALASLHRPLRSSVCCSCANCPINRWLQVTKCLLIKRDRESNG